MKFRRVLILAICLPTALGGMVAHGGYVIEADGVSASAGGIASGVNFEFVVHDFGMEPKDAIQIALDSMGSATNLHGNLLSWSLSEDYSLYDDAGPEGEGAGGNPEFDGLTDSLVSGANYPMFAEQGDFLAEAIQGFSPIDIHSIFWILGPTDVTSFSQVTAARFGFDQGE